VLVAACLYEADEDGSLRTDREGDPDPRYRVTERKVRTWPARVVRSMFDWIKRVSHLEEKEDTEESLLAEIEKLESKLSKLREAKNKADPTEDGGCSESMTVTSG
jgi:hypothetical protein